MSERDDILAVARDAELEGHVSEALKLRESIGPLSPLEELDRQFRRSNRRTLTMTRATATSFRAMGATGRLSLLSAGSALAGYLYFSLVASCMGGCGSVATATPEPCPDAGLSGGSGSAGSDGSAGSGVAAPVCSVTVVQGSMDPDGSCVAVAVVGGLGSGSGPGRLWAGFTDAQGVTRFEGVGSAAYPGGCGVASGSDGTVGLLCFDPAVSAGMELGVRGACGRVSVVVSVAGLGGCSGASPP